MTRILQLKERKKVLLQQKRELIRDYQRIQDEIKEIMKEIKDEESTNNYSNEFETNYQNESDQTTEINEREEESNDEEVEETHEQNVSTEEEIEERTQTSEINGNKRKREEIMYNEQAERMEKRQKRMMNKEEKIQKIIENERSQESEEEETNNEVRIFGKEVISVEDGAEMYKLVEKTTRKTIKMWLKYAKWFEKEIAKEKRKYPKISERTIKGRIYDEMMGYLITGEKVERKKIRENLTRQTNRALENLKLYKKQLKSKRDEQKANELKGIIEMLE
jgi:hypothetical protein